MALQTVITEMTLSHLPSVTPLPGSPGKTYSLDYMTLYFFFKKKVLTAAPRERQLQVYIRASQQLCYVHAAHCLLYISFSLLSSASEAHTAALKWI